MPSARRVRMPPRQMQQRCERAGDAPSPGRLESRASARPHVRRAAPARRRACPAGNHRTDRRAAAASAPAAAPFCPRPACRPRAIRCRPAPPRQRKPCRTSPASNACATDRARCAESARQAGRSACSSACSAPSRRCRRGSPHLPRSCEAEVLADAVQVVVHIVDPEADAIGIAASARHRRSARSGAGCRS